ncbi:MAG: hypothetical protein ACRYFL_00010 [Janthinobacterium lividum]
MKKILVFITLILAFVLVCFLPFKQQKAVNIKVQYFITLQQLLQPENWKKWQPQVKQAWEKDSAQVKISKRNTVFTIQIPGSAITFTAHGFDFYVDKNSIWKNSSYRMIAIPVLKDGTAMVHIEQKKTLLNRLFEFFGQKPSNDIEQLKQYLENTRLYYGFDIRRTTVTDSNIVVEKKTVLLQNKALEIAQTEQDLKDFIRQKDLKIVQPIVADIREAGKDSLRIMIGLPVNKQAISAGKIKFMHLPSHGRMLTGLYYGKYSGRQKLYLAMKTYITDHHLASPEDPYEKYLDNKIPVSDTSFVHLQVNFPIY